MDRPVEGFEENMVTEGMIARASRTNGTQSRREQDGSFGKKNP